MTSNGVALRAGVACVAGSLLLLSGCATELTFRRRSALDYFVGKDQTFLVGRLGQPSQIVPHGDSQWVVYAHTSGQWHAGEPLMRNDLGVAQGPWVDASNCTTTFRVVAGKVDAWRLDGNDCRAVQFPALGPDIAPVLAQASAQGVDAVAPFPHDSFTGRSMVNYGEFHSN